MNGFQTIFEYNFPLLFQLIGEIDCCREFEAVEYGGNGLSGGVLIISEPPPPPAVPFRMRRSSEGLSSSLFLPESRASREEARE